MNMDIPYYLSKDQLDQRFPFNIRRHTSKTLKQDMHAHEYIQIAYILRGVCTHQLRGKTLTVARGDIFIIAPGVQHSFNAAADKTCEMLLLDFIPALIQDQIGPFADTLLPLLNIQNRKGVLPQPWMHISKGKQQFVDQLLQDIQDELEHQENGYEFAVRMNLVKLLILIDREFRKERRKPASQPALAEQNPIDEVKRYVYDNYSQDIPLEHGAMIANMAPSYFSHVFKKETGQTFIDFMNEVRIERAMELITRDSHTITHIGFQVGFHHLSHFIRTFKKRTGITPTEYKKTFGASNSKTD